LGSIDALHSSVTDFDGYKYFVSKEAKDAIAVPRLAQQHFRLSKEIVPKRYVTYYCYYKPRDYNVEGIGRYQTFITNESASNVQYDCTLYPHIHRTCYEGYVKGPRIYVATDDLVIAPLSPSTLLHLLDRFETPFEDLMEKVVTIGIKEVVKIKIFFSFIVLLLLLKFNARLIYKECFITIVHFAVSQYIEGSFDLHICSVKWTGSLVNRS
jgi:hypothetical protein